MPLEIVVVREEGVTSFGDGALSNCQTPHDEQVLMGLEVSCDETVLVLILLDIECVGCNCGFDDLKGAGITLRMTFRRNGAEVNMLSPLKLVSPRVGARRARRELVLMAAAAMMSATGWVHLDWKVMVALTSRATTWASGPSLKRATTLLVGLMVFPPIFLML